MVIMKSEQTDTRLS